MRYQNKSCGGKILDKSLEDLLGSELDPLINGEVAVAPGVVLLEESLVLSLSWSGETMLLGSLDQLRHHGRELGDVNPATLGSVVVSEQLQHEPVQLNILGARRIGDGLLNEGLVLLHIAVVNDGMRSQSGSLGHDVLQTVVQPLIKGDDSSRLLVHGVKHLGPGILLLLLGLVEIAVLGSEPVSPRQSSGSVHQLGERFLAYQTIIVGVGLSKHLQQAVVQLRVAVALLVSHGLLNPPDEVLLGLVEGADGSGGADGHLDGFGTWFLRGKN